MATTTQEPGRHIALVYIRVPDNVGCSTPSTSRRSPARSSCRACWSLVVVHDHDGDGFELVAGFHRIAAAKSLGLAAVPVVIREAVTEDADRAVENVTSCR